MHTTDNGHEVTIGFSTPIFFAQLAPIVQLGMGWSTSKSVGVHMSNVDPLVSILCLWRFVHIQGRCMCTTEVDWRRYFM